MPEEEERRWGKRIGRETSGKKRFKKNGLMGRPPTLALYLLAGRTPGTEKEGLRWEIESGPGARWAQVMVLPGTEKGAETGEPG